MEQSDRSKFDFALQKLLYATNGTARPGATITGTYWSVLKDLPWSDVAKGMTDAVNGATGHVSPATLANFCRPAPPDVMEASENRAHDLERRMSAADAEADRAGEKRFGDLWYNQEFRDILRVANMDFARRCTGKMPGGIRVPTPDVYGYTGPFDYTAVVKAMTLPKDKKPADHSAAWECFWCVLAEEFIKHRDGNTNKNTGIS